MVFGSILGPFWVHFGSIFGPFSGRQKVRATFSGGALRVLRRTAPEKKYYTYTPDVIQHIYKIFSRTGAGRPYLHPAQVTEPPLFRHRFRDDFGIDFGIDFGMISG